MTTDPAGAGRSDPYDTFMITVRGAGRIVAGFSSLALVTRTATLAEPPEEGPDSEAIAMERGVSEDTDFVAWAARGEVASRMDLDVEVHDEAGRLVLTYRVTGCWVSELQSLPDLESDANAIRIDHLRLENDGWESVAALHEPEEITYPDAHPATGAEVSLRPVAEDWREVGDVRPKDDQRDFVHPMAAGYLLMTERSGPWNSLGIYEGESVVGHVMWGLDDDGSHWIGGLVIDQHAQGRGLGRAAAVALIAWLAEQPGHWATRLSHHPDNTAAARLYAELGFTPTGETDEHGEIILEIRA